MKQQPVVAFLYDFDKTLCTTDMQDYAFIPSLGMTPAEFWAEANGFGVLDTGTGSMEIVHVTTGKLDEAINQVNHDGTTNMLAFVIIGPNRYEVKGDTLTDC